MDNIVKPILDALSGPDGILIDDCQVQELTCYWTGSYAHPETEQIAIELRFHPDAYISKPGLIFLKVKNGLYFPIHDHGAPQAVLKLAEHLVRRYEIPAEMMAAGAGSESARLTLPVQRVSTGPGSAPSASPPSKSYASGTSMAAADPVLRPCYGLSRSPARRLRCPSSACR